ncbi:hypothetical protein L6452_02153 [Arctium lappa]|uniref:Uncharacterized protein n=1 Tax=Arctium lappa TaxID=4217 RepID=A0ACB9FIR6_ARCLA|nr:hypothetical protein L6452_02153 [Arctium lappa]
MLRSNRHIPIRHDISVDPEFRTSYFKKIIPRVFGNVPHLSLDVLPYADQSAVEDVHYEETTDDPIGDRQVDMVDMVDDC